MSRSVDNRVVELDFNNRDFEEGTRESIKSLQALKDGLDFGKTTKSIADLSGAARGFNLINMANGIGGITRGFSIMGAIGFTVIQNLTNAALKFGRQMVDRVMNPMMMGFQEYEVQMNAIQTVLANTESKGTTLEDVTAALAELNTYADMTIYNFTEMTRNIGTFTAAGVSLETSTAAIKGIANLAAVSGSNSQQASVAMYQLSQALSSGTVKLMDWNSVVNAGMGGQVFQDALKETARVSGIAIDEMIEKEGSFRETLSEGWLTSEVLLDTLKKFTGDLTAEQLATIGYTEEQIEGILKLGQTANDAATKVKTFTQLTETITEAMQSGWTRSWEIVIGDFEEAKALFTRISDTLGAMISESADARNSLLENWKYLGGRDHIIRSLFNAFEALMGLIEPIKAAWADVFPDRTLETLMKLSRGLEWLTYHLKSGIVENAENIQRIFTGIFSVFKMGIEVVSNLARVIFALLGDNVNVDVNGKGIVDTLVNIGDALTNFAKSVDIEATFDWVLDHIREKIEYIKTEIGKLIEMVTADFNETKGVLSGIFEQIDLGPIKAFFSDFKIRFRPFEAMLQATGWLLSTIFKMAKTIIPELWKVGMAIADWVGKIGKTLMEAIARINFAEIFHAVNAGMFGAMLLSIKSFISSGSGAFEEVGGVFGGVSKTLDTVRLSLEAWQQNLKSKTLMNIAISVAILAGSLVAISMVPTEKLVEVMGILTGMFLELMGAQALYAKTSGISVAAGTGILLFAGALLIMAGAIKMLANVDTDGMERALGTLYAIQAGMLGFAKIIGKNTGNLTKASVGLIATAVALLIMTVAVKQLGAVKPETLSQGLRGVGILLAEIAAFMRFTNEKGVAKAAGLIAMAVAIGILSFVVEKFGGMDVTAIQQGLLAMGVVLSEIAIFSKITGNGGNLIAMAVGMVILGAAFEILADVLTKLGNMDAAKLAIGLTGMATSLLIIAIAMKLLPKTMLLQAAGLLVVGAALVLISEAVKNMGSMTWDEIARGMVALAGALLIIGTALYFMSGTLLGAAALIVAAGALAVIAPVLMQLGSMALADIGIALLALAGVFIVLGIAGALLTPVVPTLFSLGVSMVLIGVAVALLGVGLMAFSAGLMAISVGGAAAATGIVAFITILLGLLPAVVAVLIDVIVVLAEGLKRAAPMVFDALLAILEGILQLIVDIAPLLFETIGVLLTELLELLIDFVPDFIEAVLTILLSMLESIAEKMPDFIQAGFDILMAFLEGIRDNIYDVVTTVYEIIQEFMKAVEEKLPDVIQSGWDLIIAFIDGIAEGIDNNMQPALDAVGRLAKAIMEALATGIVNGAQMVIDALVGGVMAAWQAAKDAIGWHSPAKIFVPMGGSMVEGVAVGINTLAHKASDAATEMGVETANAVEAALSRVNSLLEEDNNLQPTIRPVVDLDNVTAANSLLNQMFGETALNLNPSLAKARSISAGLAPTMSQGENRELPEGTQITFNQTNNSPKALSRVEIYRQTRLQLLKAGLYNQ